MHSLLRKWRRKRGQGMTEYIIIVAVIAVLALAIVTQFGDQIRNLFFVTGSEMAGEDESIENKMDSGNVDRGMGDL
jgi:Flp pilus assembly pilin Flp